MVFGATISYGGVTINLRNIPAIGYQIHSSKQTKGVRLTTVNIIGSGTNDRVLQIDGYFSGSTRFTSKDNLLALDDGTYHSYIDGEYDGDYVILPDSLRFSHIGNRPYEIGFRMTLLEWNM